MIEAIKKFVKNDYLVSRSFPWTVNLTNFFFLFLVFIVPLFFQDQTTKQILPWVFLVIWGTYYFFLRKKLLSKLKWLMLLLILCYCRVVSFAELFSTFYNLDNEEIRFTGVLPNTNFKQLRNRRINNDRSNKKVC